MHGWPPLRYRHIEKGDREGCVERGGMCLCIRIRMAWVGVYAWFIAWGHETARGVERALGRRRRHQISGSVLKRGWGSSLLEGRGDSLDWF